MKNKILVAGSINMDLVVEVNKLPQRGESVHGKTIRYIPGGKGSNQAVAASRLGTQVAHMGKVGKDDFGKQLLTFLESENVDTKEISTSSSPSGIAIINVEKGGNNTIVILFGTNAEVDKEYIEKNKKLIQESNVILSQFEIPIPAIELLFSIAKKSNKKTILNPSPAYKAPATLFKNTDYLVLNETELAFFNDSKKIPKTTDEIVFAAKKLSKKGPKTIVVTIGDRGAITLVENKVIRTEGIKVNTVDTTAAGDCFVGAFATQVNNGVDLEEALDFANKAAAISVQKWGASSSLPTIKDMRN